MSDATAPEAASQSVTGAVDVLTPRSEAELARMVRRTQDPLRIRGGGTRPIGQVQHGQTLATGGLSGIVRYDPGALTLVAQAGTPVDEITATLSASGQRLPFEPPDHRRLFATDGVPTIGGIVAFNASGPRRIQAGACRDSLIGVRFVNGVGEVVKNGGRVMKNVTGYDLVKLLAGSYGTLGILTEVSFKVLPAPESQATLRISGLSEPRAIEALSAALGSPFDVSGAVHLPEHVCGTPETYLRLEGLSASVTCRAQRLSEEVGRFGPVSILSDQDTADGIWKDIRDIALFAETAGDVWRISARPSEAAALAGKLGDMPRYFDWGGGLIWVCAQDGTDLRTLLGPYDGHATLFRASSETRTRLGVFEPQPAPLAALAQRLREGFDPRSVFNPGLMV